MSQIVLYTAAEVAELLRLNHQVVQRKLQAGDIPGYRIGRDWRVEQSQLLDWLEKHSNQRRVTSDAGKVLRTFLDDDGRLRSIPASRAKRAVVLEYLADQPRGRPHVPRTRVEHGVAAVPRRRRHAPPRARRRQARCQNYRWRLQACSQERRKTASLTAARRRASRTEFASRPRGPRRAGDGPDDPDVESNPSSAHHG